MVLEPPRKPVLAREREARFKEESLTNIVSTEREPQSEREKERESHQKTPQMPQNGIQNHSKATMSNALDALFTTNCHGVPNAPQREPQRYSKVPQGCPKLAQSVPKVPQSSPKASQKAPQSDHRNHPKYKPTPEILISVKCC